MNLLQLIWSRLLGTATEARLRAVEAKLTALSSDVAELKAQNQETHQKLDQILDLLTLAPADHIAFDVAIMSETGQGVERQIQGAESMTLTNSQRAQLSIRPLNRRNQPAKLDGPPTWATSDPTVATVTPGILDADANIIADPDPAGLNAVLEGVAEGACRVTVTGDADLDTAEVRNITGVLDVTVTPGEAITVEITAGAPVELPSA